MSDKPIRVSDYAYKKSSELAERFGISQKRAMELAIEALERAAKDGELRLTEIKEPRADYSATKKGAKNGK